MRMCACRALVIVMFCVCGLATLFEVAMIIRDKYRASRLAIYVQIQNDLGPPLEQGSQRQGKLTSAPQLLILLAAFVD